MRVLVVIVVSVALNACYCGIPTCELRGNAGVLKEREIADRVADGGTIWSANADCLCVRDDTVKPLKPEEPAIGYCSQSCGKGDSKCPDGWSCDVETTICKRFKLPAK